MAASGKTKGNKRKPIRTARAKGQRSQKMRSAAAAPLKASNEAKKRETGRLQQPVDRSADTMMGLMNRRAQAYLELPARMAHCNSPFQVWRVQAQFVQECFSDYARHVTTVLRGSNGRASHG
jgi:hypothetical protein